MRHFDPRIQPCVCYLPCSGPKRAACPQTAFPRTLEPAAAGAAAAAAGDEAVAAPGRRPGVISSVAKAETAGQESGVSRPQPLGMFACAKPVA